MTISVWGFYRFIVVCGENAAFEKAVGSLLSFGELLGELLELVQFQDIYNLATDVIHVTQISRERAAKKKTLQDLDVA